MNRHQIVREALRYERQAQEWYERARRMAKGSGAQRATLKRVHKLDMKAADLRARLVSA